MRKPVIMDKLTIVTNDGVRRFATVAFAALLVLHLVGGGQHTARSLVWRLKRFEACQSDLREWRKLEVFYFGAIEEVLQSASASARIRVFGNEQLALEFSYYAFPRVVLFYDYGHSVTSSATFIVEENGYW